MYPGPLNSTGPVEGLELVVVLFVSLFSVNVNRALEGSQV